MTPRNRTAFSVLVAIPFILSGFTALIYQAVLNKFFTFIFGVGGYAAASVLAAFMIGLAAGSAVIGKLTGTFFKRHVLWYGVFEFAIGAYGLVVIPLGLRVEQLFVSLAPSAGLLLVLRFVLALGLVFIPTFLMGGSLPLLMEGIQRRGIKHRVNLMYALNIAGACVGTLLAAYQLLPALHLDGSLLLVFEVNIGVLAISALVQLGFPGDDGPARSAASPSAAPAAMPRFILAVAFISGYITFANEVIWYHMLSLVVGMSTYAYAIMLFTTLVGMASAGFVVQRRARRGMDHRRFLGWSQLALAASIILTMGLWDEVPKLFLSLGAFLTSFRAMEAARFVACFALIAVPAFCAGLSFPAVLAFAEERGDALGAQVGRLYAVNTVGTVLGSLVTGFVILGLLGGRDALFLSALLSLAITVPLLARNARARVRGGVLAAAAWGAALWLTPGWDVRALLSGANVYFSQAHDDFDELVWQHEDYIGGVTSVIRRGSTLTMLTNGKFQGNNGSEVKDQTHFALIPNLYVANPRRALNIGLGTGTTLGAILKFPYAAVDAVELSGDVVDAADRWFSDVNAASLRSPRTRMHVEDGRNFLLTNPDSRRYDLISIEISSIWFAGAGNLYNDEFYGLAKRSLAPGGVFQQWIQLHHIDVRDIAVVLKTMRRHFKYLQFWIPGHQGIILASDEPFRLSKARLDELGGFPAELFDLDDRWTLLGDLVLTSDEVDALLASLEKERPLAVSTDMNLYLEYSTPRGNALGWNFSQNFEALAAFSHPDVAALLPPELAAVPEIRAMALAGRAHFLTPSSLAWHRQLDAALDALPAREDKEQMKVRILRSLSAR